MDAVSQTLWASGIKRAADIVASVILLTLFSPLIVLTACLIKVTSRGSVLFTQVRSGCNSETFRLLKFRTMRYDRVPDVSERVPLSHPDVTPLGRFLRRFKIDELPQLANVLLGHMSLVGPRPTLPDQVARYDEFRRQRLLVRPGITGLAQVNGNASVDWDERILYDVAYVRHCSFLLDLAILLRTIAVVILGEGKTTKPFAGSPFAKTISPPENYGRK